MFPHGITGKEPETETAGGNKKRHMIGITSVFKILKQIHPHIWKYGLSDPYKRECVCCHAVERW